MSLECTKSDMGSLIASVKLGAAVLVAVATTKKLLRRLTTMLTLIKLVLYVLIGFWVDLLFRKNDF